MADDSRSILDMMADPDKLRLTARLEDRVEKLAAIVRKGVEMRSAQKAYFTQGRTRDQLDVSKKLERDFDKAAAELDMPELF